MLRLSAAAHRKERTLNEKMGRIFLFHPYLALLMTGIVLPIVVLAVAAICACIIVMPAGLILGWL